MLRLKLLDKNITEVQVENIAMWDYPDFCDAYIESALVDGVPATAHTHPHTCTDLSRSSRSDAAMMSSPRCWTLTCAFAGVRVCFRCVCVFATNLKQSITNMHMRQNVETFVLIKKNIN